jgi:cytochrome c oxidase subunit 2
VACHSVDGTQIVGPTWQGLAGSTVPLSDGTTVVADTDYLLKSILDPNGQIHEGFQPGIMPLNFEELLTPEQMEQIVAFIESLQ